jgi:hypothetical protein
MKKSLLFFPVLAFLSAACERHSADSLPSHGADHAHAPAEKAAPAPAKPSPEKNEKKEAPPAAGQAPKFFEEKKAEDKKSGQ